MPDGSVGIICGPRQRITLCEFCGRASTKLCDFPIVVDGKPKTCDKRMCDACSTCAGYDLDYCPPHNRNAAAIFSQREASGLNRDGTQKTLFDGPEFTSDLRVGSRGIE
ncbi:MAG: hypothetical protein ACRDQZ_25140 [Mycobacteriales bacterium]